MPEQNRDNRKQMTGNGPSSPRSALTILLPAALGMALIVWAWRWLLAIGLLLTIGGLWKYFQAKQQEHLEELNEVFYQILQEHQGRVTTLDFAIAANITGLEAKEYLQERAREFGADFEVNTSGGIVYCFSSVKVSGWDSSEPPELKQLSGVSADSAAKVPRSLNQSQLADRFGVHAGTIRNHRSKSDFIAWSRTKDPAGIAWTYSPDTKEFLPIQNG